MKSFKILYEQLRGCCYYKYSKELAKKRQNLDK